MHRKELKSLIKECILEVLQESLLEGFDPLSQGPNVVDPTGDGNPYAAWNAKMRTLEEDVPDSSGRPSLPKTKKPSVELDWDSLVDEMSEVMYPVGNKGFTTFWHLLGYYGLTNEDADEQSKDFFIFVLKLTKRYLPYFNEVGNTIYTIPDEETLELQWMASRNETNDFNKENPQDVDENEHGRYAQEAGAGQFDPRTFGPENVTCEKCNCSFDYNSVNEVQMGLVRCPKCKTKLDQTGRSFGVK